MSERNKQLCTEISVVLDNYEREMNEHKIAEKLTKLKEQRAKIGDSPRDKKKAGKLDVEIVEWTEYVDVYNKLVEAKRALCDGVGSASCDGMKAAKRSYEAEIEKYRVLIAIARKQKMYADMMAGLDDVIVEVCRI